jgi:hypothetical protein
MRQTGSTLALVVFLLLLLIGGGFLRYQQVAQVSDPALYQMLRQQLSAELLQSGIQSLSRSLGQGELGKAAGQALSLARKQLLITQVCAARPLYDFAPFGETRFAVDYRIDDAAPGRAYLRYVSSPDQGWRYLGRSSAGGFYSFYLLRQWLPDPQ